MSRDSTNSRKLIDNDDDLHADGSPTEHLFSESLRPSTTRHPLQPAGLKLHRKLAIERTHLHPIFYAKMSSPTQQPTPTPSPSPPYNITHLDDLLASYLTQLDAYSTLRASLSTSLSSGFFSLAQAQRSSMLPPGQRYGQEMYDERMKAGRRVRVRDVEEDEIEAWEVYDYECESAEVKEAPEAKIPIKDSTPEKDAEPSEGEDEDERSTPAPEMSNEPKLPSSVIPPTKAKASSSPRNPLRQFGILTPPPLRAAQTSFTSSLATIPQLITTSRQMARLEAEIEKVRKELGLDVKVQSASEGGEEGDAKASHEPKTEQEECQTQTPIPIPPQRKSLASRSKVAEPRSRVLKLGS